MTRRRRTPEALAARREERALLTDSAPVVDAAAAFVAVRPRSVGETRKRLLRLGYPASLVEQVVSSFIELGYLDDVQFAQAWVESRDRSRPRGEHALRTELATKGVARDVIDEVLEARATSPDGNADRAAALALLGRRRSSLEREPDPRRRRQKAYALLARNGFDPEACRDAVNEAFSGQ